MKPTEGQKSENMGTHGYVIKTSRPTRSGAMFVAEMLKSWGGYSDPRRATHGVYRDGRRWIAQAIVTSKAMDDGVIDDVIGSSDYGTEFVTFV